MFPWDMGYSGYIQGKAEGFVRGAALEHNAVREERRDLRNRERRFDRHVREERRDLRDREQRLAEREAAQNGETYLPTSITFDI